MSARILALGFLVAVHGWALGEPPKDAPAVNLRRELQNLDGVRASQRAIEAARQPVPDHGLYQDYRAALQVELGGKGLLSSRQGTVLRAAQATRTRVVAWDVPPGGNPRLWRGMRRGVLFLTSGGDIPAEVRGATTTNRGLAFLSRVIAGLDGPAEGAIGDRIPERGGDLASRDVSVHIFARELSEEAIRLSLREGRVYVARDWMADPSGFTFGAVNNLGVFTTGDGVPWLGKTRVVALVPVPARLKIIHGTQVVAEATGTRLEAEVKDVGDYRVEAWLELGGKEHRWICANPVRIELPTAAMLTLPSTELAPSVQVAKDITYIDGPEPDAAKHKLDVYAPKQGGQFPVILFAHGGSWKSGDRSQYPAIGNRFAKEGVCFVIPSYRLAPKHPHPAQIEDIAAAFAWTVKNIAKHGGDPSRIYVAGHSAGGHLVGLLALDPRWLRPHGLTSRSIRGVIAMSGAYDLSQGDAADNVFGRDPAKRREASPVSYVKRPAPPFLVTYCQWDYMLLPAQAIQFHAALRGAGVKADLVYVPGENHISEVISMTHDRDLSVESILAFLKK